jgi:hypothetical protein
MKRTISLPVSFPLSRENEADKNIPFAEQLFKRFRANPDYARYSDEHLRALCDAMDRFETAATAAEEK